MAAPNSRAKAIAGIVDGGIIASDYDGCLGPIYPAPAHSYRSPGVLHSFQLLGATPGILALTVSGRPRRMTADGAPGIEDFLRTDRVHRLDPVTAEITEEQETPLGQFDPAGLGYVLPDGRRGRIHVIANHGADLDPSLVETQADRELAAELFAEMTEPQRESRARMLAELPRWLEEAHPEFPVALDVDLKKPDRIYLEVKPEGVAVHTRTLSARHPAEAERIRATAAAFYIGKSTEWGVPLFATPGSEVLEIQVRAASKGAPIAFLHAKYPGRPITYIGDDITDLAAFGTLNPGDTAIVVGDKLTRELAQRGLPEGVNVLHLASPVALVDFLDEAAASLPDSGRVNRHRTARSVSQVTSHPQPGHAQGLGRSPKISP